MIVEKLISILSSYNLSQEVYIDKASREDLSPYMKIDSVVADSSEKPIIIIKED